MLELLLARSRTVPNPPTMDRCPPIRFWETVRFVWFGLVTSWVLSSQLCAAQRSRLRIREINGRPGQFN